MAREAEICGACVALLRESFKVTELGRREKITCSQCNKRRYGCRCIITKKEDKRCFSAKTN